MSFWSRLPPDRLLAEASLWSADATRFAEEIHRMDAFADLYHFDVSDAHFVPGLLFFPDLVAALRPLSRRPFHAHLMVEDPVPLLVDFARAGADIVTVHCENTHAVPAALQKARELRCALGLALACDTPLECLLPWIDQVDLVLLMGTPLGVKGCDLSAQAVTRIRKLRRVLADRGIGERVKIEADGGIREHTVPAIREAGADIVVTGSLAFRSPDPAKTFEWLRSL